MSFPERPVLQNRWQLRRLQTNTSYGSWAEVAALIKKEMQWQMPGMFMKGAL